MPSYDPQRSRPRQRVADDEGPAPVDALLGGAPEADPAAPAPAADVPTGDAVPPPVREPLVIDLDRPGPATAARGRRRVLLPLVAVVAVVVEVVAWRWWRRRVAAGSSSEAAT